MTDRVSREIPLDLLQNAVNSIVHGMEHYAAGEKDPIEFKFAIQHMTHGAELLLKERLAKEHPLLIWEDVAKPRRRSVTWEAALERLRAAGVDLAKYQRNLITLRNLRNRIEHYAITLNEKEAAAAISGVLPFIFEFPVAHLGISLQTALPNPRAWEELLKLKEFRKHAMDSAVVMKAAGTYSVLNHSCAVCGELLLVTHQDAVTGDRGFCLMCGCEIDVAFCEMCNEFYESDLVGLSDVTGPDLDMCVWCVQEHLDRLEDGLALAGDDD